MGIAEGIGMFLTNMEAEVFPLCCYLEYQSAQPDSGAVLTVTTKVTRGLDIKMCHGRAMINQ